MPDKLPISEAVPITCTFNRMFRAFRNSAKVGSTFLRMASTASSTNKKLAGKVAIVTASTDGIGFAIARRLGIDGAKVVISSRKQKNVDKAVAKLKEEDIDVFGLVCHVAKPEDRQRLIEETVKRNGGIDILVSNAAANPHFGPILDCSETHWDKIFETNVKSTFFLCKEAVPHMEKRGGGSIVLVASFAGYVPMELIAPYSVSKTALLGLVKALTPQCASMNIRVNGLAPGIIQTSFSGALVSNPDAAEQVLQHVPLRRFGKPDDCAGIVSFMVSDDASYMTGENVVISGGMNSRL